MAAKEKRSLQVALQRSADERGALPAIFGSTTLAAVCAREVLIACRLLFFRASLDRIRKTAKQKMRACAQHSECLPGALPIARRRGCPLATVHC